MILLQNLDPNIHSRNDKFIQAEFVCETTDIDRVPDGSCLFFDSVDQNDAFHHRRELSSVDPFYESIESGRFIFGEDTFVVDCFGEAAVKHGFEVWNSLA